MLVELRGHQRLCDTGSVSSCRRLYITSALVQWSFVFLLLLPQHENHLVLETHGDFLPVVLTCLIHQQLWKKKKQQLLLSSPCMNFFFCGLWNCNDSSPLLLRGLLSLQTLAFFLLLKKKKTRETD
jgi:hypothetical protein